MAFDEIIGHSEIIKALEGSLIAGKTGHAYLFVGPSGVGKKTLARSLAVRLLCIGKLEGVNCHCQSCRRFYSDSHPDFKTVVPQGNAIKIEQLRELQHQAYFSPVLGRKKVYFFPEAEKLTDVAANSFLKLLEEAPPGIVFIFTAVRADKILPTIRSRCQVYQLFPVPTAEIEAGLERLGLPREEAQKRSNLSQGLPGVALRTPFNNELEEDRITFAAISQSSLLQLLKLADQLDKRERKEVVSLLADWEAELRGNLLKIKDNSTDVKSFLKMVSTLEKLVQVIMMSEYNVSIRLLLEDFFIWLKQENL